MSFPITLARIRGLDWDGLPSVFFVADGKTVAEKNNALGHSRLAAFKWQRVVQKYLDFFSAFQYILGH